MEPVIINAIILVILASIHSYVLVKNMHLVSKIGSGYMVPIYLYFVLRFLDLLSTYIVTPDLALEYNYFVRKYDLGWDFLIGINILYAALTLLVYLGSILLYKENELFHDIFKYLFFDIHNAFKEISLRRFICVLLVLYSIMTVYQRTVISLLLFVNNVFYYVLIHNLFKETLLHRIIIMYYSYGGYAGIVECYTIVLTIIFLYILIRRSLMSIKKEMYL